MRALGFGVNRHFRVRSPAAPGGRYGHLAASNGPARRIDDALMVVFRRACADHKLDAAEELLDVLTKWQQRRASRFGRERRISDNGLRAMRVELDRLKTLRA